MKLFQSSYRLPRKQNPELLVFIFLSCDTVRINKAAPKCKPKLLTSANMATCPKELSAIARFGLLSLDLATAVIAVILCFQLYRNGGKKWTITHVIFLIIPLIPLARFVGKISALQHLS